MLSILSTPGGRFLAGLLVVVLLVGGAFAYGDHRGYGRAETAHQATEAADLAKRSQAALTELHRQIDANADAKSDEAKGITEDERAEAALSQLEQEHKIEAHQDPAASQPALGAGSVQRLNKIR